MAVVSGIVLNYLKIPTIIGYILTGTLTTYLFGLHVDLDEFLEGSLDDSEIDPQYSEFMKMLQQLTDAYSTLSKDYELYWLEA